LVLVLDFYHASEHLWEAVCLCPGLSKKERTKLYKKVTTQPKKVVEIIGFIV
jgi:hypothetical protein